MSQNKIFRLDTRNNQVNALQLKGSVLTPNGIIYEKAEDKDRLIVVSFKEEAPIYEVSLTDLSVKVILYTPMNFLDGIVMDRVGNFYITAWENQNLGGGKLYRYDYNFEQPEFLLSTGLSGPAALYFNKILDSLLVPNMLTNSISYFYYPSKPALVEKVYPPNNSKNVARTFAFQWKRADGSLKYTLQIATNIDFTDNLIEMKINHPDILTQKGTLDANTTYFWRIRAENLKEDGDWGDTWTFKTIDIVDYKPILILPEDESRNVALKPEFKWHARPVQSYEIIVFDNPIEMGEPVLNIKDLKDTSYIHNKDFEKNTLYCWRVRGHTTEPKEWSDQWCFKTIGDVPAKPQLTLPQNGANEISIDCTLLWEFQEEADYYILYLSTNQDMSDAEIYNIKSGNSIEIKHLNYETAYYWQVVAVNAAGESEPSDIWTFTTVSSSSVIDFINDKVIVYPNPASESFELYFDSSSLKNVKVCILNSIGIEISTINTLDNKISVNTHNLNSGIYYLKIISNDFSIIRQICIIK